MDLGSTWGFLLLGRFLELTLNRPLFLFPPLELLSGTDWGESQAELVSRGGIPETMTGGDLRKKTQPLRWQSDWESKSAHPLLSPHHPLLCPTPEGSPSSYLTYTPLAVIAVYFLWVRVNDAILIIPPLAPQQTFSSILFS